MHKMQKIVRFHAHKIIDAKNIRIQIPTMHRVVPDEYTPYTYRCLNHENIPENDGKTELQLFQARIFQ